MAMPGTTTTAPTGVSRSTTDYRAMTIATVLFFMWGFLTCLNDILIPRLKGIFELNYAQVMMVQFAFFSSYFVFAQPAGWLVEWRGYKQTMVIGLLVMAAGAMLFLPAASLASFGVFLTALVILAAGMTCLQVAANPYVTSLGPENTAASRLNFSQGFNSLGTTIAPLVGGALILGGTQISPSKLHSLPAALIQAYRAQQASSVRLPYLGIGLTLVALAVALALLKMPPMVTSRPTQDFRPGAFNQGDGSVDTIWRHPWLLMGAAGIFLYVGAEVSIGSFLVNYFGLPQIMSMSQQTAAKFVGFYWGGAMIGRFIGSAVLQRVSTGLVLGCAAVVAGRHFDAHPRPHRDVGHHRRRPLQLRHVPQHLHPRPVEPWPAHQQRLRPAGHVHPRRRAAAPARRPHRRQDRRAACLLHPGPLLRLYRVLRVRRPQPHDLRSRRPAHPRRPRRIDPLDPPKLRTTTSRPSSLCAPFIAVSPR
jgi:FHS family L-fucose permease-like MFS transporter